MDRRALLAGAVALLAAPLAAPAEQTGMMYRVGVLEPASAALNAANLDALRKGLAEVGYVEGRNLVIEYRSADGRDERFPELARSLVSSRVDLIITRGTPAVMAAHAATRTIPIVMAASGDPIGASVVPSLANPGGNVTGLSALNADLIGKRLQLLKEAVPSLTRVALLFDMGNPAIASQFRAAEIASRTIGLRPQLLDVRTGDQLASGFDAAVKQQAGAVVIGGGAAALSNLARIAELAAARRLPSMSSLRDFVLAGGLMAYGVNYPELYRHVARYVDKIFKGAKPADLPIQQPTKFDLVINLKTAKALGLKIPQSVLLRADEVIE